MNAFLWLMFLPIQSKFVERNFSQGLVLLLGLLWPAAFVAVFGFTEVGLIMISGPIIGWLLIALLLALVAYLVGRRHHRWERRCQSERYEDHLALEIDAL